MTRVEEFDTFYSATRRHMLHLTFALSGDRTTAASAAADAYRHAWQQWSKLRSGDPVEYVRHESSRLAAFQSGTHPWRRRREDGGDVELVQALQKLSPTARRLFVLQTLGELGLDAAAREVGLTDTAAVELTQVTLASLESTLSCDLDTIETRMRDLGHVTDTLSLPRPSVIRRQSRRRTRRNTVVAVAAATAAVIGAGLVATESGPLHRADASASRERVGDGTTPDAETAALIADESRLLDADQISRLNPERDWKIAGTDSSLDNPEPYATCAESRFADPEAAGGFVRTYNAVGAGRESAAEAIEISADNAAADRAHSAMLRWYTDCALPRVQLVGTYTVDRPTVDVKILQLRTWGNPNRTFTVGLSRSGVINSALIHEADGVAGPDIAQFAQSIRDSMAMVCGATGGDCGQGFDARATLPPPSTTEKPFLGIVDLPPVANVDKPWVGTDSTSADPNPAATVCDNAKFTGQGITKARSRVFVIPGAKGLPKQFGISESIARFRSNQEASRFVRSLRDKIDACPDDNLSASITQESKVKSKGVSGRTWRITFEVDSNTKSFYRLGLVRRGRDVAQVSFSPTPESDVQPAAFNDLATRSGERLAYNTD